MRFEQFDHKHKHLKLKQDEVVRKWKMQLQDEEQRLFEAAARNLQNQAAPAPMVGCGAPVSSGSAQLMVIKERDASTFTYYVYNYENNSVSGPHDTEVPTANFEFGWSYQYIVNKSGFLHIFRNGSNDYALMFVGIDGIIIETVYLNTLDLSYDTYDGKFIVVTDYDARTTWIFDGIKVYTDTTTFTSVDTFGINTNWNSSSKDGVIFYSHTDLGGGDIEKKYYLGNTNGITQIFAEITATGIDYYDRYTFESDKVLIYTYNNISGFYTGFKIINTAGVLLHEVELTVDTYDAIQSNRFGTSKFFINFYNNSEHYINVYNAATDNLLNTTLDRTNYPNFTFKHSIKNPYNFSDADFSENLIMIFSNPTGNSLNDLNEVDYCKFISYFESEDDLVIADYADNEAKYIYFADTYTPSVFMFLVDDGGLLKMLVFGSTGTFSYLDLNASSQYFDNVNYERLGNNLFFHFLNTDTDLYHIQMINESGTEFDFLDESIQGFYYNYEYSTIVLRDYDNKLSWYHNSTSNGWVSTEYYYDFNNTNGYSTATKTSNGVLIGYGKDTLYFFNDMPDSYDTVNCSIENGSSTVTGSTSSLSTGMEVSGDNIPKFARITNILDGNSFEMSVEATATATQDLFFRNVDFIADGGDDMYDDGNYLSTDLGDIQYTHTQMNLEDDSVSVTINDYIKDGQVVAGTASNFGTSSSYFTNFYPGLFVLSASDISITDFYISGDIGADGSGSNDNYDYTPTGYSTDYKAYIKRVWDADDPSITQIFIVNTDGTGITHNAFDSYNDDDNNNLTGLDSVTKFHYLLFAKSNSSKATDTEVEAIINSYLTLVDNKTITASLTALNNGYNSIISNIPLPTGEEITIYKKTSPVNLTIDSPQDLRIGKSIFAYWYNDANRENKITLKVYNHYGTLLRTIETNDEFESSFTVVENSVFLSTYTKYFDGNLFYVYNYNHVGTSGTKKITKTVGDETNLRWTINDYPWWND